MAKDPGTVAHQQWLGYVQPEGLVVSIPALLDANARLNQNIAPEHNRFLQALPSNNGEPVPQISNFPEFVRAVFDWPLEDLYGSSGSPPVPDSLQVTLPVYNETLQPTYALRSYQPKDPSREWILLVQVLPQGTTFDAVIQADSRQWQAGPQTRFERLLRQANVFVGLITNGQEIRLVYAPDKELSGHITFNIADMVKVAGRPIFAAMHMLLSSERLYSVAEKERLPAILANSRKYQNVVSTKLAEQVMEALYELLRGFQAADDKCHGALLKDVLAKDPDHVYRGLLTTLLRLVFLLYAEDRGLISTDPVYSNHYSITGLYERLRSDDGRYHDTMYQRYGAWAQLLVLFRLVFSGARHGSMRIQERKGYLFDPDQYLFLEGRHGRKDKPEIPRVSDGVVFHVLSNLLILDGERLSYRTLAVEQIGSVYQAIMGFGLQVATGPSIAIKPVKKHGAPATINLEEMLRTPAEKRIKWLSDNTDQKLAGEAADAVKAAKNIEEMLAALERKIAKPVTPNVVPKGAMIFQPSDERRKSGSHYTPSSLTGPIVEAALEPVLKQLGENPTPAQILNLKACDPAMGSAAFLVEACRQLGEALVKAWHAHDEVPSIPPDEDEALCAQRIVAQRCLYGLDKNEMATDLAKLSLWLATLAKDHPFTFLDHSLRHGDSLVGLTRKQIAAFNWAPAAQQTFFEQKLRSLIERVSEYRQRILSAREETAYAQLEQELAAAEDTLNLPRMIGDAVVAAFFSAEKPKQREETRKHFQAQIEADLKKLGMIALSGDVDRAITTSHSGRKGVRPFHWELEFPEVFGTDKPGSMAGGFDMFVGNPPFLGGRNISGSFGKAYLEWLFTLTDGAAGQTDLIAYFFRRSYERLRPSGTLGFIATNTVAQGDTRRSGLAWICKHGGTIYRARRRLAWPGIAAVVVSVIHIAKELTIDPCVLDERKVHLITAFLLHLGTSEDPQPLLSNRGVAFKGQEPYGKGFQFADGDPDASPLIEMERLIKLEPRNSERIFPYLGGSEILGDPQHRHHRFVIYFGEMEENEAANWPALLEICRRKVLVERSAKDKDVAAWPYWRFWRTRPGLSLAVKGLTKVLVHPFTSTHLAFAFVPANTIVASPHVVIATESYAAFAVLQSRIHELWARLTSSTLKDDLSYKVSDSFDTFPLPPDWQIHSALMSAGKDFYEFRSALLVRNNQGLTKTYNRFHDPSESDPTLQKLRELQDMMDRAVLGVYDWADINSQCEFIPEFDEEEDEHESGQSDEKKYRYRWPDEIRDEVLARLLELNRQRATEEGQILPPHAKSIQAATSSKQSSRKSQPEGASGLLAIRKGEV